MNERSAGFTAIDLFAGIGGFRMAIERCGGECIAFSEINKDAVDTYLRNFPGSNETNLGDITRISDIPRCDFLCGGVPCQSWSNAGKMLGFDDARGKLWNDAIHFLECSRPKAFIFENVKGLADTRNAPALDYICDHIRRAGYTASCHVLNSLDYGVPQGRKRLYIVGFSDAAYHDAFLVPKSSNCDSTIGDILEDDIIESIDDNNINDDGYTDSNNEDTGKHSTTWNRNFGDCFMFTDVRNGPTTIHSWDMLNTTDRQKNICQLLLRNRRKRIYGPLDGNPLSLEQLQSLDSSITQDDMDGLVELGIMRVEKYAYHVIKPPSDISVTESMVLERADEQCIIPDVLTRDQQLRTARVNIVETVRLLEDSGVIECVETRYDFRQSRLSTGLFGVSRVIMPTSRWFPTLTASDSNDYVTPVAIVSRNLEDYRRRFIDEVITPGRYRKITRIEACRIQGFPDGFLLPNTRSRWMRLIGNSVTPPVIESILESIMDTGVFND